MPCGSATRNAAATRTTEVPASHDLGSSSKPGRPAARGNPKTDMADRYGLYEAADTRRPGGRYGLPWRSRRDAALATTLP